MTLTVYIVEVDKWVCNCTRNMNNGCNSQESGKITVNTIKNKNLYEYGNYMKTKPEKRYKKLYNN